MNILTLNDVHKRYGDTILFRGVNLAIGAGETLCIKTGVLDGGTTLLKMLAGLVEADRGTILLEGKPYAEHHPTALFNNVAMCFEEGGVLDVFTNYNNIVLPMLYHLDIEHDVIHERIYSIAEKLDLAPHMGLEPFQLNDVQKRLLNLCKALVVKPKVIIVDELQSGMSNDIRDRVLQFLKDEQQQLQFSIIMTTTAGDRTDFADRVFSIVDHTLIEEVT